MEPRLVLAATPIGNPGDASARLRDFLARADVIAAEDTRRAQRLLASLEIATSAQLVSFYDAVEDAKSSALLDRVMAGDLVVVISDAGMPTVSDPGYRLTQEATARGIDWTVLPGPSAVLTALALSGLPTDRFTFDGFLPRKAGERKRFLQHLAREERTMVFFEAPHRCADSVSDLAEIFGADRPAALCRELTKTYEEVVRGNLADLVAWSNREILGEITLVVAGCTPITITDPDEWVRLVGVRVAAGLSQRDAIAEVAKELGVPKREVYDAVLSGGR